MNINPSSTAEIRFSDCDLFGHLNNARYLDYFLHAREQHLKHEYGMHLQNFYKEGLGWVINSHEIVYLKPALYAEIVNIQTTLRRVTEDSLVAEMLMTNEKRSHIKAIVWTKFTPVNIKTGKKDIHPTALMELLNQLENKEAAVTGNIQDRINTLLAQMSTMKQEQ